MKNKAIIIKQKNNILLEILERETSGIVVKLKKHWMKHSSMSINPINAIMEIKPLINYSNKEMMKYQETYAFLEEVLEKDFENKTEYLLGIYLIVYYLTAKTGLNFENTEVREFCKNYIYHIGNKEEYSLPFPLIDLDEVIFKYDLTYLQLNYIKEALILATVIEEVKFVKYKEILANIQQYEDENNKEFTNWLKLVKIEINI